MFSLFFQKIAPFRLAIGWGVFITVLSVMPSSQFPRFEWGDWLSIDKIFHFGFYALLTWLILGGGHFSPFRVAVACSAYGLALEFVQRYWCIGRSFDVSDAFYNALGALVAAYYFRKKINVKNE